MAVRVEELFLYNAWAMERIIDACETLSPGQLDAPAEGTAGTIRDTLTHIIAAEQRYIQRLGGDVPQPFLDDDAQRGLDELKRMAALNGEVLASIAGSAPPDWQHKGVTEYGLAFDTAGIVFLLQAANHGASHRQQVASWLTSHGLGPKDLDEQIDPWSWGVETGALKTGPA